MVCIVAFLLLVDREKTALNRLVLVGNDTPESFYNVYEPGSEGFPIPSGDIRMSKVQTETLGTYQALYCSRSLKSKDIAHRLTEALSDLTSRSHYTVNLVRPAVTTCYHHLQTLKSGISEGELPWSSVNQEKCTPELILNLCYNNVVRVTGPFEDFFPVPDSFIVKINIDKSLGLAELIDNQRVFKNKGWSKNHVVLAWYQRNLHLFQLIEGRYWITVTRVGAETFNGAMLFYFVLGLDRKIWNLHPHVSTNIHQSLASPSWRRHEEKITDYVYSVSGLPNQNIEMSTTCLLHVLYAAKYIERLVIGESPAKCLQAPLKHPLHRWASWNLSPITEAWHKFMTNRKKNMSKMMDLQNEYLECIHTDHCC